ncbi:hypothetical protein Galf_0675 [Gallionella capsiferriformans ES-2]|uniref:Integrase catalytic region n=1 Tax=Gallionella capsiferriformans (strain ES-2) TaxID=395494 RepID=D9SD27_GALCS|nr:hypothetical protein Galf_0675 [Gallionella capsiferriformans ES-2]
MQNFNPLVVLAVVRAECSIRRKRSTWGTSVLTKYLAELITLRNNGASLAEIRFWLKKHKRIKVARSTIKRFLDKKKAAVI